MRFKRASLLWAAALCATPGLLLPSSLALAADLIINEVSAKNQDCVIVHEIPGDEGKANAVRLIERTRDMFWPGREIIDATKVDDSTLKEKLKKGFTLYTTIGATSKLFKATTGRLGIRIEGKMLTWNGVSAPVSELRIIAVGKNPYGEGNCVVYAAGSSKLLGGINSCFHGPCSYHIYQGDKLLKEGLYKDGFGPSSGRLTRAEAEADVHQFFSTLQRVHPDLLAKVTLEDYIRLKVQTRQDVAKRLDGSGTISINDFAHVLFYAAAYFGDGHTSVQWMFRPNESNSAGVRFPPFLLDYDNGRFVIAASGDKALVGMEVLSVDGKPIRKFLRPILDRCSGETIVFKAARFTSNQAFWYSLCRLCGSAPSLALRTRDANGAEGEHTVKTVGFADFEKLAANTPSDKRDKLRRQGTHVAFLDSNRIAHFVYPQFILNDGEKKKVDSIFAEIKAKNARELVIDLRGNGGGNSSMGDFIFSYLYGEKFTSFSKMRIKLNRDVLTSYLKNQERLGRADLEGLTATFSGVEEKSMAKPRAFFSGRVFLLVDNGTFSSAAGFTTMFRDYAVGTIIGYETGGLPVCFGDIYSFSLANSRISCGVSYKQFFGPKPRPGDDEHGVIPDIPMSDKLLRPYQNEEDPVFAFTLDHVKRTRQ